SPFAASPVRRGVPRSEAAVARPALDLDAPAPPVAPLPAKRPGRPPRPSIAKTVTAPDRYTEDVTVPMTAEMRTRATLLAAELQRRRTNKSVRFTPNTVFRVAIETLFERFELSPGDHVNSEDELRRLVLERIASGNRSKVSPT